MQVHDDPLTDTDKYVMALQELFSFRNAHSPAKELNGTNDVEATSTNDNQTQHGPENHTKKRGRPNIFFADAIRWFCKRDSESDLNTSFLSEFAAQCINSEALFTIEMDSVEQELHAVSQKEKRKKGQ